MADATIVGVRARSIDIPLHTAFGIAAGRVETAEIAVAELTLADGTVGIGEAAPFTAVNGETRRSALETIAGAADVLAGRNAAAWRHAAAIVQEFAPGSPSAVCALQTALLDAFARHAGISLLHFFGSAETTLTTDITVVVGSVEESSRFAAKARADGFRTLKIKIGGGSIEDDVARLEAVATAAVDARWILDGNAAFTPEAAIDLVKRLGTHASKVDLFEQPTPADDLEGLRRVHAATGLRIAADESARTPADVARVFDARAAQVINVKIMKCGIVPALDMIAAARALGLDLMIGGMVESPLAMTMSACMAAGIGGFRHVDLDTPFFMRDPPFDGGYRAAGPRLSLDQVDKGHGVSLRSL
jgi:L-alanine-DL-glutamate epimerase-like enolase superfamily enzyme